MNGGSLNPTFLSTQENDCVKSPVITSVVEHDLCIGCGLCAALCPQGILAMQWNCYGEYNPVETSPCTTECGLCLKACPFADSGENEDTIAKRLYGAVPGIRHRSETGYYLASYVGYSERHRPTSASGGMATWLLETLLTEGVVDHVICVSPTGDPERLFSFQVFDTPEDVRTGAGSAYYPVEMSEVIRQVLEVPGRYAVTGLPCFLKAIRLAQQRNKKLRERIVVTVGLTCGQLKSRQFTEYIADLAGVRGEVAGVRYRGKSQDQPANNFYFSFTTADGKERRLFWNEGIAEAWRNRWFTPEACNYCDDVFAECADVTCMDAWLPDFSGDPGGTSLLIVRSGEMLNLIEECCAFGKISVASINISRVVRSQRSVITIKKSHLAYRLYQDELLRKVFPKKRIRSSSNLSELERWKCKTICAMQRQSREFTLKNGCYLKDGASSLKGEMYWDLMQLRLIRFLSFPFRAVRYGLELVAQTLDRR
ncbi:MULTISPECIES: Coenzyme F420 hydrogenase/dehydrogenase, beta subunit C-terminal domain [Methanoculleus]